MSPMTDMGAFPPSEANSGISLIARGMDAGRTRNEPMLAGKGRRNALVAHIANVHDSFSFAYQAEMGHPTADDLTSMCLAALEEVGARCRHQKQEQTRGVAVALAYLAHVAGSGDRYQFDRFWRSMRVECRTMRAAEAYSSLNAIYAVVGRNRTVEVMSAFERAAQAKYGPLSGYPGLGD